MYLPGKTFAWARNIDIAGSIDCIRYYAGWADKVTGQVQEVCNFSHPPPLFADDRNRQAKTSSPTLATSRSVSSYVFN